MILGEPVIVRPVRDRQNDEEVARRVRKEDGAMLADAGEIVITTSYWLRRLQDGDIVAVATPSAAKADNKQLPQPAVEQEVVIVDPKTTKKG